MTSNDTIKLTPIDKLRKDLEHFNCSSIARLAKVSQPTISGFIRGEHTMSTEKYFSVRKVVDNIAKDILGE